MIKQIFLIKRKSGLNFDEFKKHYLEVHAPLVKKSLPDIQKYVVSLAIQRGKESLYDAVTEIYWNDFETIVKIAKSDIYKNVIRADEEKFIGTAEVILTEEYPQK